jgi:hypothetical protein
MNRFVLLENWIVTLKNIFNVVFMKIENFKHMNKKPFRALVRISAEMDAISD